MVAQQQTAAPAGISVPAVPALTSSKSEGPRSLHFRVRVIDGRNGIPVPNAHIKIWYDEPGGVGYGIASDPQGFANMPAPVGEPVRVLASVSDYADCRRSMQGDPPIAYNLQKIAATGLATQNACGNVAVRPAVGQLILFVRPSRWYEGLNRNSGN